MRQASLPDVSALYEMELLSGLPSCEIARFYDAMQYRLYRKGDVILAQGQRSKAVFFIHRGLVKICDGVPNDIEPDQLTQRHTVLNLSGPGAMLGEVNILDGAGHSATVITLENTACFMLENALFHGFLKTIPRLEENFYRHLGTLIRRQNIKYCCALQNDLVGRVATALLMLAERFGAPLADDSVLLTVPLTRTLLGEMTGNSRESVGRTLKFFAEHGCIAIDEQHRITIRSDDGLRRYCHVAIE